MNDRYIDNNGWFYCYSIENNKLYHDIEKVTNFNFIGSSRIDGYPIFKTNNNLKYFNNFLGYDYVLNINDHIIPFNLNQDNTKLYIKIELCNKKLFTLNLREQKLKRILK
jgi:hypothetical protein